VEKIWLQTYPKDVPADINPNLYPSLVALFETNCQRFSNKTAFSNLGTELTYAELEEKSHHFAAFLQQELKLAKGTRVAIMMPNLLQYPIVLFGALCAGMTVVNVNPLYTPPELAHQLRDSGAEAIVVLANFAHVLEKALSQTAIKHVIVTEVGDLFGSVKGALVNFVVKHIKKMVPAWQIAGALKFNNVLQQGAQKSFQRVEINGDDIAFLQYTGGTTGVAKGAMLSHRNMVANVTQALAWFGDRLHPGEEIVIAALPLYHIFALTICSLAFLGVGAHAVLITNPRDIPQFIKTLRRLPFTIFIGVNTLYNALLNRPEFSRLDFKSLHLNVAGGMAMQRPIAERWRQLTGTFILEGYGLTEASPIVSVNPANITEFTGSIGLPMPSTDVKICDEEGKEVALGESGELYVKGPQVMPGYWQRPDETKKVFTEDGWLKTGDVVRMDAKGFMYMVDRKKDMVIVSGFNVYPSEVEEVIAAHPGVLEVGVIGVTSEKSGEVVKAFIVKKDPNLTEKDILDFCGEHLTRYKIPKIIVFRDELPKSNVGKILRRKLREL
jgi:long-chain acyl-CoA synthetase